MATLVTGQGVLWAVAACREPRDLQQGPPAATQSQQGDIPATRAGSDLVGRVPDVGDQHVARRVGDRERRPRLHHRRLRRHPARPEHRHVAGPEVDRVAEVGRRQVGDPSAAGSPTCTGAPCTARETRGHRRRGHRRAGTGRIDTTSGPVNRPPAGSATTSGTSARSRPARRAAPARPPPQQRALEGEAAADEERDEVVAPDVADVGRLGDQLAVHPDAVAREVGAEVARRRAARRLARVESRRARGTAAGCAGRRGGSPRPGRAGPRSGWPACSRRTSLRSG